MADDQNWRLRADPGTAEAERSAEDLLGRVRGHDGAEGSDPDVPSDVVITHDGSRLFAYAASEAAIGVVRSAVQFHAPQASIVISHWDDQLDEWLQVEPALTGEASQAEQVRERDEETVETRTLISSAGKLIRTELEQSMQRWADQLGLQLSLQEHRHLLTYQVLFEVTGPRRKLDEFAAGLKAEEVATLRSERGVMLSGL